MKVYYKAYEAGLNHWFYGQVETDLNTPEELLKRYVLVLRLNMTK